MRIQINGAARLTEEKLDGRNQINQTIDRARRMFITPIIGQEMIYLEKESEARRYIAANPEPITLTEYPFIAAETGVTADTPYEVAQLYLNLGSQWRAVGAALENIRQTQITAVDAATTISQVTTAVSTAQTSVDVLLSME